MAEKDRPSPRRKPGPYDHLVPKGTIPDGYIVFQRPTGEIIYIRPLYLDWYEAGELEVDDDGAGLAQLVAEPTRRRKTTTRPSKPTTAYTAEPGQPFLVKRKKARLVTSTSRSDASDLGLSIVEPECEADAETDRKPPGRGAPKNGRDSSTEDLGGDEKRLRMKSSVTPPTQALSKTDRPTLRQTPTTIVSRSRTHIDMPTPTRLRMRRSSRYRWMRHLCPHHLPLRLKRRALMQRR